MKAMIIYMVVICCFCLLSLKYFPSPWIWIFIASIIILSTLVLMEKKQRVKIILLNSLAIPIALLLAESYYYYISLQEVEITRTGTYATEGYYKGDKFLGYAPQPGIQRTLKRMRGDEVVYDVTYTINDNGIRMTPSSDGDSEKCLLFFGGSFTFGEGLNDDETFPYFVGKGLQGKYRILNFGFHGYGPHQMLSAVENGLVENDIRECQQVDVIYSCLPTHVARSAGYSPWDKHGPKYLVENGKLTYKGRFDSPFGPAQDFFWGAKDLL